MPRDHADAVQALMSEAARRREMLLAAFIDEQGIAPNQAMLVFHQQPDLMACWPIAKERRRSLREWLRDTFTRRRARAAGEFRELGLDAGDTALFVQLRPSFRVYYAAKRSLQVNCRVCRKRVALVDFDNHATKH